MQRLSLPLPRDAEMHSIDISVRNPSSTIADSWSIPESSLELHLPARYLRHALISANYLASGQFKGPRHCVDEHVALSAASLNLVRLMNFSKSNKTNTAGQARRINNY